MKHYIITGASKGIGAALVNLLAGKDTHLHTIARSSHADILQQAVDQGAEISSYSCDLSDTSETLPTIGSILQNIQADQHLDEVVLINNAGLVQPVGPSGQLDPLEIEKSLHVNLTSPLQLTNEFLSLTKEMDCKKTIINISSGAGKSPFDGWSTYCTSKAGLDLFTRSVGIEQDRLATNTTIVSFSPGIVDTPMQEEIRSESKENFVNVETFQHYKDQNKLSHPETVAASIQNLLQDSNLQNGGLYDVTDYL
ncbi:(S)-benzoin forming benzil reductase [Salsuginibacillus kocurii]|uniref:(S)-benzoin forming benzil reductase n=1 Tax=Salsuginibacillus kocurii TaxID=427078 RepID=UPI0003781265|nr:(S)-benzoin forming benzil reductase [Salsuginibacillus kocurii]